MYSRKPSSLISLSVKMNDVGLAKTPACRYSGLKSSSKLIAEYAFVIVICENVAPATNDASRVSDCLPEPPTPTSSAQPRGILRMREMRMKWRSASSNSTRSTAWSLLFSLNRSMYPPSRSRTRGRSATGS